MWIVIGKILKRNLTSPSSDSVAGNHVRVRSNTAKLPRHGGHSMSIVYAKHVSLGNMPLGVPYGFRRLRRRRASCGVCVGSVSPFSDMSVQVALEQVGPDKGTAAVGKIAAESLAGVVVELMALTETAGSA